MSSPWRIRAAWCLFILGCLTTAVSRAPAQTAVQVYSEGVEAYKQGDVEAAKHKLALALEIDKNFRPASTLLARIAVDQRAGGANAPGMSFKALQTTVVPVEFKDTTLTSALEILRQRAEETTGGKLKINFAVNLPPEVANRKVTLKLDRVPLTEVMRYMGELTGTNFEVQRFAIVVTPATVVSSTPATGSTP